MANPSEVFDGGDSHPCDNHIVDLKRQNRLKVGTEVKMQSASDDDVRKRLLDKPRFELAAKGACIQTGKMLHLLVIRSIRSRTEALHTPKEEGCRRGYPLPTRDS